MGKAAKRLYKNMLASCFLSVYLPYYPVLYTSCYNSRRFDAPKNLLKKFLGAHENVVTSLHAKNTKMDFRYGMAKSPCIYARHIMQSARLLVCLVKSAVARIQSPC